MKIAIIGNGYVGKAYHKFFPEAVMYNRHLTIRQMDDSEQGYHDIEGNNREEVNKCDIAIVCVPTVMREDKSCDTSIVEEVVGWLETPLILIKSTIPPGTTRALKKATGKRICHSPEYVGEGGYFMPFWKYVDPLDPTSHDFMIIGGDPDDREDILQAFYPVLGPTKTYYQVDETTSELIKYMENCAIAAKVILCNEFYNIAEAFGVNYSQVREGFVLDKRQGEMFTLVYKNRRGFDGKCLPKDTNALVKASTEAGYTPEFIKAIINNNERIKRGT